MDISNNNKNNNSNSNNSNKKESLIDRVNKIVEEEGKKSLSQEEVIDIKDILEINGKTLDLEQLEKRRQYLEREITDINRVLAQKNPPPAEYTPWYKDYPIINDTITHPDFQTLAQQVSIMSLVGIVMGGLHGYSVGKKQLRESIAKSSHSPLTINSIHLNAKRTIGLMVVRNAFVLSYRCGIYTLVYGGVEAFMKHNIGESPVNSIVGGSAVGLLAGFHLRKRGNLAIPFLFIIGTSVGGMVAMTEYVNKNVSSFFNKEEKVEIK